jgi:hypothetical protein
VDGESRRAASVACWLILAFLLALASAGAILILRGLPGLEWLRLDVVWERDGFAIYLPLGACIIASLILTGALALARRSRSARRGR